MHAHICGSEDEFVAVSKVSQGGYRLEAGRGVVMWMRRGPERDPGQKMWKVHGDLLDVRTEGEIVGHLEVCLLGDFGSGGPIC